MVFYVVLNFGANIEEISQFTNLVLGFILISFQGLNERLSRGLTMLGKQFLSPLQIRNPAHLDGKQFFKYSNNPNQEQLWEIVGVCCQECYIIPTKKYYSILNERIMASAKQLCLQEDKLASTQYNFCLFIPYNTQQRVYIPINP